MNEKLLKALIAAGLAPGLAATFAAISKDVKDEENAIKMYKGIIEKASKEGDVTTAFIFKEILEDEEEHHDFFTTALEDL